jgi:acetyl-CoA C-acetyltransferase
MAHAVVEYGNAIKDLVAANIFPGDMLWKNFGVTRHGKVVFYDYDEIEYITDCNFRRVPEPRNEEEEMSGEVWYTVGPKDVFPETFGPFLLGNTQVREVFMAHHADLLDAAFWQATRSASRPATCTTCFRTSRPSGAVSGSNWAPGAGEPPAGQAGVVETVGVADALVGPPGLRPAPKEQPSLAAQCPRWHVRPHRHRVRRPHAHRRPAGRLCQPRRLGTGRGGHPAAVERAGVPGDAVDEVLFGNCLMAGQGQAPARQAMRRAGLPDSTGAVTLTKMCGSGMRAMMFAHDMLAAGSASVMVAGGMESMTNAPHLMFARKGVKYGAAQLFDHMAMDGLEDAYERGKAMGVFAEQCVDKYRFTRERRTSSPSRPPRVPRQANEDGSFDWEMAPVALPGKAGETMIKFDEQPFKAKLDKIPGLKPAFKKDGTITAANASSISDGAAALVLVRESTARQMGLTPIARIVSHAVHAQAPEWFATAPAGAIRKALAKAGWQTGGGPVGSQRGLRRGDHGRDGRVQAAARDRQRARRRLRPGPPHRRQRGAHRRHLLGALRKRGLKRGVASLCIGGGEATALAVEML